MFKVQKIAFASALVFFLGSASAESEISPIPKVTNEWRSSITPYVWGPGLMTTVKNNNGPVSSADFSMGQVLSNLKSGVMGASEIHKGKWGVMTDMFFATLQNTGSFNATDSTGSARVADKITLQATVLTGSALYTVVDTKDLNMDVLLGVRAAFATASLSLNDRATSVNASTTFNTIDPIAGFKGRYRLADSTWYVPFYADAGGGGGTTSLTWQAMLGVGKAITKSFDVSLVYRALYADLRGEGSEMKANLKGPQLNFTFNF
jgi:hypothetical protein